MRTIKVIIITCVALLLGSALVEWGALNGDIPGISLGVLATLTALTVSLGFVVYRQEKKLETSHKD